MNKLTSWDTSGSPDELDSFALGDRRGRHGSARLRGRKVHGNIYYSKVSTFF